MYTEKKKEPKLEGKVVRIPERPQSQSELGQCGLTLGSLPSRGLPWVPGGLEWACREAVFPRNGGSRKAFGTQKEEGKQRELSGAKEKRLRKFLLSRRREGRSGGRDMYNKDTSTQL